MKKRLVILGLVLVMACLMLAGCSSKGECESCKKEAELETVELNGEEAELCEDCAKLVDLGKAFADLN